MSIFESSGSVSSTRFRSSASTNFISDIFCVSIGTHSFLESLLRGYEKFIFGLKRKSGVPQGDVRRPYDGLTQGGLGSVSSGGGRSRIHFGHGRWQMLRRGPFGLSAFRSQEYHEAK